MFQRVQGASAGAAVVARDQDDIGLGLGDPCSHRTDSRLAHEFHVDVGLRIGSLEVKNELLEVFNGVNVVVRRRRDEPHPRGAVAKLRNPRIDLVGR
ncbi:MAG: Uncharacterised protein [Cellulomonadaceae bacterium TMED98]|nr:MAG: Uncharacterised protein [Cellulomonadaceae bacterium TMED98]